MSTQKPETKFVTVRMIGGMIHELRVQSYNLDGPLWRFITTTHEVFIRSDLIEMIEMPRE